MMKLIGRAVWPTSVLIVLALTGCSSSSANFPTREELEIADIESRDELWDFLGCLGAGSFHHQSVTNSDEALEIARQHIDGVPTMAGHDELVEAIPVGQELWAIADSDGRVVGSVEDGQMVVICENKPPGYAEPTVRYLKPGEGGDE